jgi:hypothetical protein
MSSIKDYNRAAFVRAAKSLRKAGHKVVSPIEMDDKAGTKPAIEVGSCAYQSLLHRDLQALLTCDSIHTLDGWEKSRGASLEVMVGKELGLIFVDAQGVKLGTPRAHHESILIEAERIIHGPRQKAYGHPLGDFERTGRLWAAILGLDAVSPEKVGLCMVALKISRECNTHTRDNLVDMAGYSGTLDLIVRKREESALTGLHERSV